MSETSLSPKRPRLDFDENSSKDEHFDKYKSRDRERDQEDQSNHSHSHSKHRKRAEPAEEEEEGKDEEGKTKLSSAETARREHTLVMRLTNKEQELQDCLNQIQEMKQAQTQNTSQLRSMLLDPAINLVFQRMAKEMDDHKDKLKQKQNELTAWKFTPDSQTGMRVMARCRMLLQENGELGKMISSGRTARLEGEIVLHKALATEMKKNQRELDEFVGELEEDMEGMQGVFFMLRQQLKEAKEQIARLQAENEQLRTLSIPPDPEPGGSSNTNTPLHVWADTEHSSDQVTASLDSTTAVAQKRTAQLTSPSAVKSEHNLVSGSPLSTDDPSHQEHLLSVAQPVEDFNSSGAFASKVTPDSGIHTQEEEEDTSMDTCDSTPATEAAHTASQQQTSQSCDQSENAQLTGSEDTIPSTEQQAATAKNLAEKRTSPSPVDDDHLRTTSETAPVANNNSSSSKDSPSHHPLPSLKQVPSPEARTRDPSGLVAAIETPAEEGASTQGSNDVADPPAIARTTQSLSHHDDEAALDKATLPLDSQRGIIQDENKSELHQSLGLGINPKVEEDKVECQTALGLVNGSAKAHN